MIDQDVEFLSKEELKQEIIRLRVAIRKHRDYSGYAYSYPNDKALYSVLPEPQQQTDKSFSLPNRDEF